jgi:hypothetical protein
MNIALGAVIIFIILLPPIAFYVSYSFGYQSKAGPKFSLLDSILASAIFSLIIHAVAIALIGKEIRFDILLKLLGGEIKDLENKISNTVFQQSLWQFAIYNAIIFVIAVALGRLVRYLVIQIDRHHNNELLRPFNRWWYLFNGYYLIQIGHESRDYDFVFVDAVVDTKDGTIIYSGYLVEFICNGEELDRIYLNDTIKKYFKRQNANVEGERKIFSNEDEKEIPGQFLCIPYKEILNLNVTFVAIENSLDDLQTFPDDFANLESLITPG